MSYVLYKIMAQILKLTDFALYGIMRKLLILTVAALLYIEYVSKRCYMFLLKVFLWGFVFFRFYPSPENLPPQKLCSQEIRCKQHRRTTLFQTMSSFSRPCHSSPFLVDSKTWTGHRRPGIETNSTQKVAMACWKYKHSFGHLPVSGFSCAFGRNEEWTDLRM